LGSIGVFTIGISILTIPVLLLLHINGWAIFSVVVFQIVLGSALIRLDQCKFNADVKTVGDLAKSAASYNYGVFAREGGRNNQAELWNSFLEIIAPFSESLPKESIKRETILLRSQLETRARPSPS
jgi:hypothetical protein